MWRRWHQQQEPSIGQPMLMDTTMDERYLETIPEVESIRSARSSVAAALPDLPFRAVPPLNEVHPAFRDSHVASLYSQPSPTLPQDDVRDLTPRSTPDRADISPVSTPRSSINFAASDTSLVSPIEPTFSIPPRPPQPEQQKVSHIPRLVSHETQDMPNFGTSPSARDKKQDTKWDKYTGEQTTAETGLPSQAPRPGTQQPLEMQFPQLRERTKQILAGLRDRESAKKTPWGKSPPPVDAADPLDNPVQKVPWKGASGRTTLVDPVQNTPAARKGPINFPQRNVSRMNPAQDQARTMTPENAPAEPASVPVPTRSISPEKPPQPAYQPVQQPAPISSSPPKAEPSVRLVASQEDIKPVAPLKVRSPRVISPVEAQNMASLQSPFHSPHPSQATVPENGHLVPKLKDPPKPRYAFEKDSPPDTSEVKVPRKAVAERNQSLGASHLQHEPESRFSWTTYATTVNDSPRSMVTAQMSSSPIPPMPPMSAPLMVRKRPVSTAQSALPYSNIDASHSKASIISRKAIPSDRNRTASVMSSSASKSLPPTPIELEAGDKISSLEARMDDLGRRKRNNSKITQELTASLKKNGINYDMRKRKEVEKMIINLALECDEITQEEHEVGLTLHRSQKKRDREDCYENPTGLWIKRVTS